MREVLPLMLWFGLALAGIAILANTITGLHTVRNVDVAANWDGHAP